MTLGEHWKGVVSPAHATVAGNADAAGERGGGEIVRRDSRTDAMRIVVVGVMMVAIA